MVLRQGHCSRSLPNPDRMAQSSIRACLQIGHHVCRPMTRSHLGGTSSKFDSVFFYVPKYCVYCTSNVDRSILSQRLFFGVGTLLPHSVRGAKDASPSNRRSLFTPTPNDLTQPNRPFATRKLQGKRYALFSCLEDETHWALNTLMLRTTLYTSGGLENR